MRARRGSIATPWCLCFAGWRWGPSHRRSLCLGFLLWDYWPLQRMFPPAGFAAAPANTVYPSRSFFWLVKEKLPLFFLSAVDAVLTIYTQKSVRLELMPPFSLRFKNAVFSYWVYIKDVFWPTGMAPERPQLGRFVTAWQVLAVLLFWSRLLCW